MDAKRALCPRCGSEQEASAFCMSCGARLPRPPVVQEAAFAPTVATATPLGIPEVSPLAAAPVGTFAPAGTPVPAVRPFYSPPGASATVPPPATPAPVPSASAPAPAPSASAPVAVLTPTPSVAPAAPALPPAGVPGVAPTTPSIAPVGGHDRSVVVIAANAQLVGVAARTGEVVWRNEIEQGTVELAIAHGLVVAAVGQFLYCCEYRSGRPLWRAETSFHARRASMVVEGDLVYAFGNGTLDCFDGRGHRLWSRVLSPGLDVRAAIGLPGNISQADQG